MELKFRSEGNKLVLKEIGNGTPHLITAKIMERSFKRGQVAWIESYLITPKKSSMKNNDSYHIDVQASLDNHINFLRHSPRIAT